MITGAWRSPGALRFDRFDQLCASPAPREASSPFSCSFYGTLSDASTCAVFAAGIICAFLPPIVQSVLAHVGHIDIIIWCARLQQRAGFFAMKLDGNVFGALFSGCYIMGVAPLIMVASSSVGAAGLWNVAFTLGEVLWSPRTDTMAAQIAPDGLEATFFSLAAAPQFLAKWYGASLQATSAFKLPADADRPTDCAFDFHCCGRPTGIFSGWLLDTYVPECSSCMDNHGYYCDQQPAEGSFFTVGGAARCLSRFECAATRANGTVNGLDFACACGANVAPEQAPEWCRTSCSSLSTTSSGLAAPGRCPSTCKGCAGWSADPTGMW